MDEAMLSSPDPLNDTPTFKSPPKTQRSSRVRQSLPLQGSSPAKQTFELDVGNRLSPQKLRVTVEAGSDGQDGDSHFFADGHASSPSHAPMNRQKERTTTTIVKLKGFSDSEEETQHAATPKRGRGRPGKSVGTSPAPNKKKGRASTPIRKSNSRRKRIGDLVDGDDEEDIDFKIGAGVETQRGKGRSRSRTTKAATQKSTPALNQVESEKPGSITASKGRGRRKPISSEQAVVSEDTSSLSNINGGTDHVEMSGALQGNYTNNSQSAYSTIRSSTTMGIGEDDIMVARFDPGNETPHRTGWSSPRIIHALSSPSLKTGAYPSPSISPEKSRLSQYGGDSIAVSLEPQYDRPESTHESCDYYEEDCLGELEELDTILESEGFSMISVESVPFLREHLSGPPSQQKMGSTSPIRNMSLESVRKPANKDLSFSNIPGDGLEIAPLGHKTSVSNMLPIPDGRINDSFSSIAPGILEAATPAQKTQLSKFRSRNLRPEDPFSSIAPEILEAATPGRNMPKKAPTAIPLPQSEAYDDSFSAIPAAVLDAATPAAKHRNSIKINDTASGRLSASEPRLSVSPSRLLTPEETPSPSNESACDESETVDKIPEPISHAQEHNLANQSSLMNLHMHSSPPSAAPRRYTYTAHLRRRSQLHPNLTQTPSIIFSSPTLPPPIQIQRGHPELAPQLEQRLTLSPIARAGLALQHIVVPSPQRNRSQSLGSPFKSPATERKSPSSAAQELYSSALQEQRHGRPLPTLGFNGNLSSLSSQRDNWSDTVHHNDPFHNNAPVQQSPPFPDEKQQYSLAIPEEDRFTGPRLATIISESTSVRSDGAMSWQAEEEISVPEGPSSSVQQNCVDSTATWEQKWAAERATVSQQNASANPKQIITIDSDDEGPIDVQIDDDDDFGLLLETLNSSSPAAPQPQCKEQPKNNSGGPRRSKIPSPWRQNSKRLVYSDELSHLSSPLMAPRVSLASGSQNKVLPEPVTIPRIIEAPEFSDDAEAEDLSEWQIPQKTNFMPRARDSGNLDLSALLSRSPAKRLPVLSRNSQRPYHQHQVSSNRDMSTEVRNAAIERSVDSNPRELTPFNLIPQKMGFTPRSRDSSPAKQLKSHGIFGNPPKNCIFNAYENPSSATASSGRTPLSPSRDNTINRQRPAPSTNSSPSISSNISSVFSRSSNSSKENCATQSRTQKWTESLNFASVPTPIPNPQLVLSTSQTKSCLRTPLKTPSDSSFGGGLSPSKNVQFVSSSPAPSPSTIKKLSPTKWSKDHWILLDEILQAWKPENATTSPISDTFTKSRKRNSTRVISKLLGKTVSSEGERLKLEQWHLEAVDEFRGRVDGWEERVIAMRVFALVVGEERRSLGLVDSVAGRKTFRGEQVWT